MQRQAHGAGHGVVFGAEGVGEHHGIGLHLGDAEHLKAAALRPTVVVVRATVGGQLQRAAAGHMQLPRAQAPRPAANEGAHGELPSR